jgi:hypothetical protein
VESNALKLGTIRFHSNVVSFSIFFLCQYMCLCGLVVRVPGYRSRGLGSIPGATRFSESWWDWNGLMSTIEELLVRKSSGSSLENWDYSHRDPLRWPRNTLCPQKLALTSPTSGGLSIGIVLSRTEATECVCFTSKVTICCTCDG